MTEPTNLAKLSTFIPSSDKRKFKKLAAHIQTPMYRRLEDWIRFDNLYFERYAEVLDIEKLKEIYLNNQE